LERLMPHPADGELLAHMDGELDPGEEARVGDHLESCAECALRLNLLRREAEAFSRSLLVFDDAIPTPADPGPIPVGVSSRAAIRRRFRKTGWSLARAAGLILVLTGAAAALVPGSPVRSWLGELLTAVVEPPATRVEETSGSVEPGVPTVLGPSAISVEPEADRLIVRLRGFARESNVHVRLTDTRRAAVRVVGAAGSPRFVTAPGLLEVIGTEEGDVWVELPRSVSDAIVQVDGETAVRIRDGQLRIFRPVLDSLREDVVFRIGD
jgi:hypothetical protein